MFSANQLAILEALRAVQRGDIKRGKSLYVGLTDEGITKATGIAPNSERPARVQLLKDGWVMDSGRRRQVASGRTAVVWAACTPDTAPAPKLPTLWWRDLAADMGRALNGLSDSGCWCKVKVGRGHDDACMRAREAMGNFRRAYARGKSVL